MKNKSLSMINIAVLFAAITYGTHTFAEEKTVNSGQTLDSINPTNNDIITVTDNITLKNTLFFDTTDIKLTIKSNTTVFRTIDGGNTFNTENISSKTGRQFIITDSNLNLTIGNINFANGYANDNGGAINDRNNLTISGTSEFSNNSAQGDGGAIAAGNIVTISGTSTFTDNSAQDDGGAIFADNVIFTGNESNVRFTGNKIGSEEDGWTPNDITTFSLQGITIQDQGTYYFGGGIDTKESGQLTIQSGAEVTFGEDSVSVIDGATTFDHATVTFNRASFEIKNNLTFKGPTTILSNTNITASNFILNNTFLTLENTNTSPEFKTLLTTTGTITVESDSINSLAIIHRADQAGRVISGNASTLTSTSIAVLLQGEASNSNQIAYISVIDETGITTKTETTSSTFNLIRGKKNNEGATTLSGLSIQSDDIIIVTANGNLGENTLSFTSDTTLTIQSNTTDFRTIDGGNTFNAENISLGTGKQFINTTNLNLAIGNINFANGYSNKNGGAIFAWNNLTILGTSEFSNNSAQFFGGAIYAMNDITISGTSTFTDNFATHEGGAIYAMNDITISGTSTFTDNSALYNGGAIYADHDITILGTSEFSNNSAQYGGAIYANRDITISGTSTFTDNFAGSGGAIAADNVTISGTSTFTDNFAESDGGAIAAGNIVTISGISKFSNNSALDNGGAIYADNNITISGTSTFTNNSALNGGAIKAGNVIFKGKGSNVRFTGNKIGSEEDGWTPNDITTFSSQGITIQDQGTYYFGGGIDTKESGQLTIQSGAEVTLGANSISQISGDLTVNDATLIFEISDAREEIPIITVDGNVTLSNNAQINFAAASDIIQNQTFDVYLIKANNIDLSSLSVNTTVNNAFWTISTSLEEENTQYWATITTHASSVDSVFGNGNGATALAGNDILMGNNSEVRRNINGATGELVASLSQAQNARQREVLMTNANKQAALLSKKSQQSQVAMTSENDTACSFQINGLANTQTAPEETPWEIEVSYYGQRGEVENYHQYNGYDYDYNGVVLDISKSISSARLGVAFDFGRTDLDAVASKLNSETYGAIAYYSQLLPYDFYTTVQVGGNYGDNEIRRYFAGRHKGDFSSYNFSANIELGKVFFLQEDFLLTPYISGTYNNYTAKSYNDDLLHYSRNRLDYADGILGLRLQKSFALFSCPTTIHAGLAFIHQFTDEQTDMEVRNRTTHVGAKVRGQFGSRNLLKASIGIESQISSDTSVGLGYSFLDNNEVGEHSFNVSVNFRF